MKNIFKILAVFALMVLSAAPSYAWVSVGFRVGGVRVGINPFWPVYPIPAYYAEPVYSQPVVVQQPIYQQPVYSQPAYQQPVAAPSSTMIPDTEAMQPVARPSQNGRQLLADFHARLTRAENILNRQVSLGGITQAQYNRETEGLNKIANDERQWVVANNGSLSIGQINNLSVRLEQTELQIQRDLSE